MSASRTTAAARHALGAAAEALILVAILAALVVAISPAIREVPSALAGKPSAGSGTGLVVPDGVFAGRTTATAGAAYRWVHARCTQAGTVVYEQWVKADAAGNATLTLGPTPMWTSGAADCWAEDGNWNKSRWRQTSTTTFFVSA